MATTTVIFVRVSNLGSNITTEDIIALLGDIYTHEIGIELKCEVGKKGRSKNSAILSVPEAKRDEVLTLNGFELFGRKVKVAVIPISENSEPEIGAFQSVASIGTSAASVLDKECASTSTSNGGGENMELEAATTPTSSTVLSNPPPPPRKFKPAQAESPGTTRGEPMLTQQEEGNSKVFFLRFSTVKTPFFALPSHVEVALKLSNHFQQFGMKMIPIYGRGQDMAYKVELRDEVRKSGQGLLFSDVLVPLLAWEKPKRREGLLLTFQGGASGALEEIPSAVFDDQIAELKLDLIVDTRTQFWKGTTVQNGNRMCVIETPENLRTIPESMPVTNPTTG